MKSQWQEDRNEPTPFNPLKEFERMIGEKRHTIKKLWTILTIAFIIILVQQAIVIYAVNQPKTEPIFISVNDIGETKYLGGMKNTSMGSVVTPDMVEAQVRNFITHMHTIPQDVEVLYQNYHNIYAMLSYNATTKLNDQLKKEDPSELVGFENRSVQIETVIELTENSYQIDFYVTKTETNGLYPVRMHKRAIVTTMIASPAEKDILLNPAGIYIKNYDITDIEEIK